MRILYVAISCGPNLGSEDAIGWNIPLEMSHIGHEVVVLTRGDKRQEIESYVFTHPGLRYPRFEYVSLPPLARLCKGPAYSLRAKMWLRKAARRVEALHAERPFDVMHQITPVEFRSVIDVALPGCGKYLGPIGGGERALLPLASYLSDDEPAERIRALMNRCAARGLRRRGVLGRYRGVWFANDETREYLRSEGVDVAGARIMPDVGVGNVGAGLSTPAGALPCDPAKGGEGATPIEVAYVGRLVPRKGVSVLLDACAALGQEGVSHRLTVCGDGPQMDSLKKQARKLGLSGVRFYGRVAHDQVHDFIRRSDVVVMPSVRETGGTVVAETLACGRPVVAFDAFGAHVMLRGCPSLLVRPEEGPEGLAAAIVSAAAEMRSGGGSEILADLARPLGWGQKASYFDRCYRTGRCLDPLGPEG